VNRPDFSAAVVDQGKVLNYLLSASHPAGRSRARFFAQMGFVRENWADLAAALVAQANRNSVALVANSPFGVKYTIDGEIESPNGSRAAIRTIWIVEPHIPVPRLITAYPL
jgi:hypothetical protein